jgi:magnesium chelatase family protein
MAKTFVPVLVGVDIEIIEVEAFVGSGFSGLTILGLSGDVVRDMRERVRAVLEGCGAALPARKIVVSFSPVTHLKLSRTNLEELDFAVAACVVKALDEEKESRATAKKAQTREFFAGALSLSGGLRPVSRPLVLSALEFKERQHGSGACFHVAAGTEIPLSGHFVFHQNFESWMKNRSSMWVGSFDAASAPSGLGDDNEFSFERRLEKVYAVLDVFAENPKLLTAMLAAGAGGHNMLLAGEPGVGKSFAVKHLEKLLPPLSSDELFQVQLIADEQGSHVFTWSRGRPFRAPHHSCTSAALVGGANLKPGEVTLAHHGVLFLDELAEFSRTSLEALREPLDAGKIVISRASGSVAFPALFQLCATTNPCPCGFLFSRKRSCRCSQGEISRYLSRLSGPLMDRFGIQVVVEPDVLELDSFSRSLQTELQNGGRNSVAERFVMVQIENRGRDCLRARDLSVLGEKAEVVSRRTDGHLEKLAGTLLALFPHAESPSWQDVSAFRVMEERFARIRS